MRLFSILLLAGLAAVHCVAAPAKQPHIVFVVGDHEYRSELTMPALARELEKHFAARTTVLIAERPDGTRDEQYEKNIPGLEKLAEADLAIFYLRWRQLPKEQVDLIQKYLDSGKPIIGFRTSTHAFNYPKGHELQRWNAFGEFALGSPPGWGAAGHTHYGHNSSTDVTVAKNAATHPILKGVASEFHVRSWLYHVLPKYPPTNATVLLMGKAVEPNKPAIDNPVAWTWQTKSGARVFTTTLGHPDDFKVESFQRVVVNAVHWTLDKPSPEKWPGKLDINVAYERN